MPMRSLPKFCLWCETGILKREAKKYCSRACSAAAQVRQAEVTCLTCLKSFRLPMSHAARGNGKYCSKNCMAIDYKERLKDQTSPPAPLPGPANSNWKGGKKTPRPCPVCGTIFTTANKTCSFKCGGILRAGPHLRGENSARHQQAMARPPHICRHCKKEYRGQPSGRGYGKNYCSRECSMRATKLSFFALYIYDSLKERGFDVILEKSWPWLRRPKSKQNMRIDIYLPLADVAIEYDGRQHREVAFKGSAKTLKEIQVRDARKDYLLKRHRIPFDPPFRLADQYRRSLSPDRVYQPVSIARLVESPRPARV
mgnify:CR=1 FL=1